MNELKELICGVLGVTEREWNDFFVMYGYDADPMLLANKPTANDVSGLQNILESSNPYYGGVS